MKTKVLFAAAVLLLLISISAQGIGVSVASFFPRNGLFSHPVSPLSLRNLDRKFGSYFALSGNLSLYGIGGLGINSAGGSPLTTTALVGPFQSVLSSLLVRIILPINPIELHAEGGLFGMYNINPPLMIGNLERYMTAQGAGQDISTHFDIDARWGWGFVFGGSLTYKIQKKIGITLGALYYLGGAPMKFSGTYTADGGIAQSLPAYLEDTRLDFTGLEIQIGASYSL